MGLPLWVATVCPSPKPVRPSDLEIACPLEKQMLESRSAIVTGAARGIGRAIAVRLAVAGASVTIDDPAHAEELEATAELLRSLGCATWSCQVTCRMSPTFRR